MGTLAVEMVRSEPGRKDPLLSRLARARAGSAAVCDDDTAGVHVRPFSRCLSRIKMHWNSSYEWPAKNGGRSARAGVSQCEAH
jgi:hypothetical protein